MDAPALLENRPTISGGFIKQPWVPDLYLEDGKPYNNEGVPFLKLRVYGTPGFANLIGLGDSMNGALPREFLDYITQLRNEEVDKLIAKKRQQEANATNDSALTTARQAWIDEISASIVLELPAISGQVPACQMRVRTSSNFLSCVEMECSKENITYLQAACAVSWEAARKRQRKPKEEWPRWEECPDVRYHDCSQDGAPKRNSYIYMDFLDDKGQKHRKCFTPKPSDIPEVYEQRCRELAVFAQQMHDERHFPKPRKRKSEGSQ